MKKILLLTLCAIHIFPMHTLTESTTKKSKEVAWIKTISGITLMVYGLREGMRGANVYIRYQKDWIGPAISCFGGTLSALGYKLTTSGFDDFQKIAQSE